MESKRTTWLGGISAVAFLLLFTCETVAAPRGHGRGPVKFVGPPAHAPAHGYRNKVVFGHTLIFDVASGLYIVVGLTDCYYHEGRFYRLRGTVWEVSLRADTWTLVAIDVLPGPVQIKAKSLVKLNGNGNSLVKLNGEGNGPAKPDAAGNGDNKPAAAGNSDAKTNANAAVKPNAGGDAKPTPAAGSLAKPQGAADTKPNAATGSDGKANSADTKPAAAGSSPAKPSGASTDTKSTVKSSSPAKPAGSPTKPSSTSSSKPRTSGKGKR